MSGWVANALIATTLLMAAVLLLRAPVRRLFGANAAYALWLAPALCMILPTLPWPSLGAPMANGPVEIIWALAPAAPVDATPWLLWGWAAGALLFGGWHLAAYRRFVRRVSTGASIREGTVELVTTDAVGGPAAIGLLRPRILLPLDFADRFTPAERELALAHERAHHRRADLWANAAALLMLSLHWFNPVAHRAHRAFRSDQELACDAAVIGDAGTDTRAAYAAAVVKSAWGRAPLTTCPMSRTGSLKRRLQMVGKHRKSAFGTIGGMATAGLLALGGTMLTATSGIAASTEGASPIVRTERIVIKGAAGTNRSAEIDKILDSRCGAAARSEVETASGPGGAVTRVVQCSRNGIASGDVGGLQKARDRIAASSDMSAEDRARVLGALDEALAKMRSR